MQWILSASSRLVGALAIAVSIAGCGGGGGTSSGGDMNKGQLTLATSTLNFNVLETDDSVAQMVGVTLPDGTDFVGLTETSADPSWAGYNFESNAMRITVHPRELTPGTHTTKFDFCAPNSFGECVDTTSLNVNVNVREAPITTPASHALKRVAMADGPTTFSVALDARHASWTLESDKAWLVPVQSNVANARSAAFVVDSRTLTPGPHTAVVQMRSSSGASQALRVELELAAWTITASPITTTLSTIAGAPSGTITNFVVTSNATDAQPITVTARQDWLVLDPVRSNSFDIRAEPGAAMPPGNYIGQIDITFGQGAASISGSVDVNLVVSALSFAPSIARIDESLMVGKPSLKTLIRQVSNLGRTVPWSATADQPWVKITANAPFSSDLEVVIDPPSGLAEGSHAATITIVADVGGVPVTMQVPVGLTLAHPRYAPSLASIDVTSVNGVTILGTFVAAVTNLPSDATLSYTSSVPWITFSRPSLSVNENVGVGFAPFTLASGSYSGVVTATVTYGSFTTSATIPVSLTLTPATLSIIDFRNTAGTTASPPTQMVKHEITDVFGRTVTWSTSTPWLVLSRTTTSTNTDTVVASMSPTAGLAPGTHAAEITATTQVNGDLLTKTFVFNLVLN